jgi:hypothetical protein
VLEPRNSVFACLRETKLVPAAGLTREIGERLPVLARVSADDRQTDVVEARLVEQLSRDPGARPRPLEGA